MKGLLITLGAAIVGNMLAEKFILKSSEDDSTGFILAKEGFGMDDVARAAAVSLTVYVAHKFI